MAKHRVAAFARKLVVGSLILLAAFGTACTDGYPTKDVPLVRPETMSTTELLQQLDLVGEQAHLDRRWRYTLTPGCQLIVSTSKSFGSERKWEADLRGAEFSMRAEAADAFEVLIGGTVEPRREVIAFEGGTWTDGVRIRSLLDHLRQRCSALLPTGS